MSLIKYLFVNDFTEQEVFSTPVQGEHNQQLKQQALQIAQQNAKQEDKQFQQTITHEDKLYLIFALKNESQFLGVLVTLKSFQQHSLAFGCIQDVLEVVTKFKNQEQQNSQDEQQMQDQIEKIFEDFLDNIQNQKEKTIIITKEPQFKNEFLVDERQIENFSDLQSQLTDDEINYSEIIPPNEKNKNNLKGYILFVLFLILTIAVCGVFYLAFYTNLIETNFESIKLQLYYKN